MYIRLRKVSVCIRRAFCPCGVCLRRTVSMAVGVAAVDFSAGVSGSTDQYDKI